MAHPLHVDSSELSTGSVSNEIATAFRESWQEITEQGNTRDSTQVDYREQARPEAPQRRHTPAHRSGVVSRGWRAPGLHRRHRTPGQAVTQLFRVVKSTAL